MSGGPVGFGNLYVTTLVTGDRTCHNEGMSKPNNTYKTITINGEPVQITTGGGIIPASQTQAVAYVDLHPYIDGRKTARQLGREVRQLVAA